MDHCLHYHYPSKRYIILNACQLTATCPAGPGLTWHDIPRPSLTRWPLTHLTEVAGAVPLLRWLDHQAPVLGILVVGDAQSVTSCVSDQASWPWGQATCCPHWTPAGLLSGDSSLVPASGARTPDIRQCYDHTWYWHLTVWMHTGDIRKKTISSTHSLN